MKRVSNRALMVLMACLLVFASFGAYPVQPAAADTSEYTSTVQVTPGTVQAGDSVQVKTTVSSTVTRDLLVDVEIFDANGNQLKQKVFDNVSLTAGGTVDLTYDWVTPSTLADGTYTVSVGICAAGWGSGWYDWHAGAGHFNVGDAAPLQLAFNATATVTPTAPQLGDTVQVAANVQSTAAVTGIVAISLLDATNTAVYKQEFTDQTFAAGESKPYSLQWAIPSSALSGAYAVKIEVLNSDRSQTLYSNASVVGFTVSAPVIVTEPSNLHTHATAAVADIEVKNPQTITAEITSDTEALVLVDLVVYDPSGDMVLQKVVDNVNLEAGVAKQLPFTWTPPVDSEPGDYVVKIGVFGPNWGKMYDWNNNAGSFHVNIGPVPQITQASTVTSSAFVIGDPVDVSTDLTFDQSLPADVDIAVYDPAGNKVAGN
ncbi:MAG: hypothetical protein WCC10_13290, partial [Tumebacillaceae bacterium]